MLVGLSLLIALAGSVVGVWSSFRLRMETLFSAVTKKLGSALMAGVAIVGLHYTGMTAANFAPGSVCTARAQNIDAFVLGAVVAGFALSFQLMTLIISAFHAYRAEQASKNAASLHEANVALDLARRQLEARVAERTAALDHAHRQLVELQESERRQLSRELHDRVGQNLTALGLNLDMLRSQFSSEDRAGMRARIEDSIALVEATADAIENVMAELHPPMLDDHGLLPALQWYAKQFSEGADIDWTVLCDYPGTRVGLQIEIVVFRIAQEALNNVAKHARAAHVEIALHRLESELVLSVLDDGTGFDPMVPSGTGRGMTMMRERAHSIGGRIEINALPGEGTQVVVRVGLPA
jgi:signal transduction histidine kinase